MDEPRHIRLSGHAAPFALTDAAHERLLRYLSRSRDALAGDPDVDETVRDLEASLGDRMLRRPKGAPVDGEEMDELLAAAGDVPGPRSDEGAADGPPRGPFWCRIHEGRWFGGLCLGVAARGRFRVDWTRTVVLLLTLATGGMLGIIYLAALLVVPRVETVQEYRRLRDAPRSARA